MTDETHLWMVPYADLMSTLVILFLAMFAMTYSKGSLQYQELMAKIESNMASGAQVAPARERLEETEVAERIQQAMKGLALRDFGVTVDARYVRLRLPAPVLFRQGSDALGPQAAPVLSALGRLFATVKSPILVEGYTDDVPVAGGRFRSNWELSAARALSVVRFMSDHSGIAAQRFYVRGYAQYRPIASDATEEGRRLNRRIEISLIRGLQKEGR